MITPPDGVIPTVVIASTRDANADRVDPGELRGIVFHGYNPVEWYCLAPDEVDKFKAWAARRFPSVQIVTPSPKTAGIICPPPPLTKQDTDAAAVASTTDADAATVDEIVELAEPADTTSPHDLVREDSRKCAPKWFVPPALPV